MNYILLLAGLAGLASNPPPVIADIAVAEAFRSLCLETSALPLSERASQAGFQPAPASQILPEGADRVATPGPAPRPSANPGPSGNRETAAWTKGSIRLFTTAGQTNPSWPLPPMCGISADVADEQDLEAIIPRVMGAVGAFIRTGGSDSAGASVTLVGLDDERNALTRSSLVMRRRTGWISMTLLTDLPQETGAARE